MCMMLTTGISPAPTVSAAPARVTLLRLQDGLYAARAANAEASGANAGEGVPTLVHTTGDNDNTATTCRTHAFDPAS